MYSKKTQGWLKHLDFILLDMFCLQVAFVLAYMTRHGWASPYASPDYLNLAGVYLLVDFLVLVANRSMKNVLKRGFYKEIAQTAKHVFLVVTIVSLFLFSVKSGHEYSRIMFYLLAVYYAIVSYGVRLLWKQFLKHRKKDFVAGSVYFVTTADRAERIIQRFRNNSIINRLMQGVCILDENLVGKTLADVQVTASADTVLQDLQTRWVDEVFISLPAAYPHPGELITAIADMGIVTHLEMEELDIDRWQHQTIQKVAGITVRTVSMTLATPLQAALKRTLDILGGIVGCLITLVLTVILGPVIYIKSPGPIFFAQTRVGKNGKKFKMYKFRSMYMDAEERKAELMAQNRVQGGLMFKLEYDPRIIGCERLPDGTVKKGIGNFIRDYSLDEFPQFFNVLKGDLSLCGTRPPTVDEWEKYALHHRARLAIKPGITGLWQISGRSNITDFAAG
jgi:lipopolysaccharide/colanic/teichoic acid biosynthesis glycosyltransferase